MFGATTIPNANGSAPSNNMMNADLTQSVADQPDVIEDMDYMAQWVRNGIMLNGARAAEAGAEGDLWVNGKSLFMLHVSPIIAIYNDQLTFEWDIAPYPAGTEKHVGMSFNNPMFMSRASNHKEEAWLFMKYWGASVEGQNLLIAAGGSLPNSPNQEILEFFANAPVYANIDAEALAFAGSIGEIDPTIVMPGGNYLNDFVNGFAGAVFEGEESVFEWSPPNAELLNNNIAAARAELGL